MTYESVEDLIKIVDESVVKGRNEQSKITHEVAQLRGMSSPRIRHTLNNLCSYGPCKYLEIGTYSGSTFIPALYDNDCQGFAIDNFSQFKPEECGGYDAKADLQKRLEKYKTNLKDWDIYEEDCFDPRTLLYASQAHNVFMYDGQHEAEPTEKAIKLFGKECCAKNFILVVDDFELADSVKIGLSKGMLNFDIHKTWHLQKRDGYHEGLFIAVLSQR